MPTDIEDAREEIVNALEEALPEAGIRQDVTVILKRFADSRSPLSMNPSDSPERVPIVSFPVRVPEEKAAWSGQYQIAEAMSGGSIKKGNLRRIKIVRYATMEAFLKETLINIDDGGNLRDGPYPEFEFLTFEINGIDHSPVLLTLDDIFATFLVARV